MRVRGRWSFAGKPIPGWWVHDASAEDGLRFVATDYGWKKLRVLKCWEAGQRCELQLDHFCARRVPIHLGELHHAGPHGRGMNGAFRDDRHTVWTCKICHDRAERERTGTRWSKP